MSRPAGPSTAFHDRGYSFDQILLEGRLGGIASLRTYLSSRRTQFLRRLAEAPAGSDSHKRIEAAHSALVEAEALLPKLAARPSGGGIGLGASYLKGQRS